MTKDGTAAARTAIRVGRQGKAQAVAATRERRRGDREPGARRRVQELDRAI